MKKAIYPGSFDPVTLGHLDVIERSAKMVDHLIVGVLNNNTKSPLFSVDERVNMLKDVTKDIDNVEILSFRGLLVDFAKPDKKQKQADSQRLYHFGFYSMLCSRRYGSYRFGVY